MENEALTPTTATTTTHHPTEGDPMHTRSSYYRISLSMLGGGDDNGMSPNCSRLLQLDSIFVETSRHSFLSQVKGVSDSGTGPMLYGFSSAPPLDVEVAWSETHNETLPADSHKEWIYYLNEGATLDIHYSVSSHDPFPLARVIAQRKESLVEWTEDPSYPNITLSWNIIHGNGVIRQKITMPSDYYIGVGAVTLAILLACKVFIKCQSGGETNLQAGDNFARRAPLLTRKDDDETSWSSSYDSTSHEYPEESATNLESKPLKEGESNSSQHFCVICFDSPRDCFFLPCSHCAACFTCGTR
ncbi:hypothetical protein QJS10_CPA06g02580 [Acorus calamus]|uniref:E3 ubiquitin-protein ligase APD1-4 N-terminal domain-containing protein n=1 Tax=Acorus calamus TaxID=4465 RepID=A0AAV9EQE0_ACOCL|nr:hypothetical protein QJS10_CPA06g02580 [Acorus calamus]